MTLDDEQKVAFKAGTLAVWIENPEDGMEYKVKDIDETDHFVAERFGANGWAIIDGKLADFPKALEI